MYMNLKGFICKAVMFLCMRGFAIKVPKAKKIYVKKIKKAGFKGKVK